MWLGGSLKDDLLKRPYLIKRRQGVGVQKLPILRRHSLWTGPKNEVDSAFLYLI